METDTKNKTIVLLASILLVALFLSLYFSYPDINRRSQKILDERYQTISEILNIPVEKVKTLTEYDINTLLSAPRIQK